jgi:nucleoside-diphosphate-sugar epimerase
LAAIHPDLPNVATGAAILLLAAMKILVTGANGFIGRHLVSTLAARGDEVVAVSRFQPTPAVGVEWRLAPELSGSTDWTPMLSGCDAVVHLAGVAHRRVTDHDVYTAELQRVNVDATARLYAAACSHGIKRFVFISSLAAVTSRSIGLIEETTTARPTNLYGQSKLAAEQALAVLHKNGGIPLTLLRPPVIYGAGNPGNMDRIFRLIRLGLPLPFGRLRNRRSFLYVGNLCDAVHQCLLTSAPIAGTYFVSDGRDLSTSELIQLIAEASGRRVRLWPLPACFWRILVRLQPDGSAAKLVGSLYLDVSPLMNALKWSPPFTPKEGLCATMEK